MNLLWSRVYDIIIKTLLSTESIITASLRKNNTSRGNCFEILGFDIILDSDLKPWLLEVNLSPSLSCDSPLDMTIKSNLVTDTFNLIGVRRFDRKKESMNKVL
jgi:tubulin polyglutamylase TTLL5